MVTKNMTLADQIKKEIGNRILFCSIALFLIIFGLTFFDLSTEIDQLPARISPQIKPIEDFAMNQIMVENTQTIQLKLHDFNESNKSFQVRWFSHGDPTFNKISWQFPFFWTYNYPLSAVAGFQLGYFQVTGSFLNDKTLMNELLIRLGLLIIFALTVFWLLNPLAKKIPDKLFISPVNRFIDLISEHKSGAIWASASLPIELAELETKISNLLHNAKEYERNQAAISLGKLIAQVAHDIRSPLSALNALVKATGHIPEEQRITIRNVGQRINDIANNLLSRYRKSNADNQENSDMRDLSNELMSVLLDRIVSEKRAQYQDKMLELSFTVDEHAYGLFAKISAPEMKNVLSNLINNAVESTTEKGLIKITLAHIKSHLCISVEDHGCGMTRELQERVLAGGVSIGKTDGTGIGLASSKRLIESWGGSLTIDSTVGNGTTVRLLLPQAQAAEWFLSELFLLPNQTIIILDDDQSIHDIWNNRFANELPTEIQPTCQHFCQTESLCNSYESIPENAQFLIDYELHNSPMTGLEVIKSLNIASRSTLVTSHDDELDLRAECQAIGVKILPKTFAIHVPLTVFMEQPDLVFIDDNKMVTESWNFMGKISGKKVLTFNTTNAARTAIAILAKETPIYIDAELSQHERGEEFAKELYELGFRELYLATGYAKENFAHCYWLKDIIGKEPPFMDVLS